MSKVRSFVGAACALAMAVTLAACGGEDGADEARSTAERATEGACTPRHAGLQTVKPGVLTVSAYVSPPYTVEEGGKINGVDGAIVQRIAEMECLRYEATSVAGAALPSTVQSKRADLAIGGVYHSEERAAGFSLSTPMYRDGLSLLSKDGVSSIDGLKSKTLGVIQGYLWNEAFQKALGTGKVKTYQTSNALISDIKNGRVGAGAFTSAEAGFRAKQDPSLKAALLEATPEVPESQVKSDVVLFLNKQSTQLTNAFNDDLKALLADGTVAKALQDNGVDPSLVASGT